MVGNDRVAVDLNHGGVLEIIATRGLDRRRGRLSLCARAGDESDAILLAGRHGFKRPGRWMSSMADIAQQVLVDGDAFILTRAAASRLDTFAINAASDIDRIPGLQAVRGMLNGLPWFRFAARMGVVAVGCHVIVLGQAGGRPACEHDNHESGHQQQSSFRAAISKMPESWVILIHCFSFSNTEIVCYLSTSVAPVPKA